MNKTRARGFVAATLFAGLTLSGVVMADAPNFAGPYQIEHRTLGPANVVMNVLAYKNGQEVEHQLECWLDEGIHSDYAFCPSIDVALPMQVRSEYEYASIIGFDLVPLEDWAAENNAEIQDVFTEYPPQKAEAEWTGGWFWGGKWVCNIEDSDIAKCVEACGGDASASAEVYPPGSGTNANSEPQCEVSCDCVNGTDVSSWIDMPEVLPSGI